MHCVFRYYPVSLSHFSTLIPQTNNRNPPHFTTLFFYLFLPKGSGIHKQNKKWSIPSHPIHLEIAPSPCVCVCVCFGYTIRPSVSHCIVRMQGPADQLTVPVLYTFGLCAPPTCNGHNRPIGAIKKWRGFFFGFLATFYQSPVYIQTKYFCSRLTSIIEVGEREKGKESRA